MTSLLEFIDPPHPFDGLNRGPRTALAAVAAHRSVEEAGKRLYRSARTIGAQVDDAADSLAKLGLGDGSRGSAKRLAVVHNLVDVDLTAIDPTAVRDPGRRTVITVTPEDRPFEPRRHALAERLLVTLGFRPEEVFGRWTNEAGHVVSEPGWQVVGMPDGCAIMLANLFHQDCVVSNGMLYQTGRASLGGTIWARVAMSVEEYPAKHVPPTGDCTIRADGSAWAIDFGELFLVPEPGVPDTLLSVG